MSDFPDWLGNIPGLFDELPDWISDIPVSEPTSQDTLWPVDVYRPVEQVRSLEYDLILDRSELAYITSLADDELVDLDINELPPCLLPPGEWTGQPQPKSFWLTVYKTWTGFVDAWEACPGCMSLTQKDLDRGLSQDQRDWLMTNLDIEWFVRKLAARR